MAEVPRRVPAVNHGRCIHLLGLAISFFFEYKSQDSLQAHRGNYAIFDLCLRKTRSEKSFENGDFIVFEKLLLQNICFPHVGKRKSL